MMSKAVVVFSGGQDSTTCLVQALNQYSEVHCLTFDYGQRHRHEIQIAIALTKTLNVQAHKIIDATVLNEFAVSSLTRDNLPVPTWDPDSSELPDTFVPGRNILFLTLAAIYAYQVSAETVITGVCETDFSGYPDCRNEFVMALQQAVRLGLAKDVNFITPLMWLDKAETWALADYWQQLPLIREQTLTCYNGLKAEGCGECAACALRRTGLKAYQRAPEVIMQRMKEKTGLN